MKVQSTAITSVLCALFAGFAVTEASDTVEVTEGGVTFSVKIYDDGRSKPYKIKWDDPEAGFTSKLKFNEYGSVTNIEADGDKFKIQYDDSGDVTLVKHTNARRTLLEEGDGVDEAIDGNGSTPTDGHRRLFDCDDCVNSLDFLVENAVDSVCVLVDYGAPITDSAATAISIFCELFGDADADVACEELCNPTCLAPLTISLQWTSDADLDLYVVEPFGGDRVFYYSRLGRFGYLDQDSSYGSQGPEQYIMYSRFSTTESSWSTGSQPIGEYWIVVNSYSEDYVPFMVTATDGYGNVLLEVEDEFKSECFETNEISLFYRLYFDEYVDNSCSFSDLASIEASAIIVESDKKPGKGNRKNEVL